MEKENIIRARENLARIELLVKEYYQELEALEKEPQDDSSASAAINKVKFDLVWQNIGDAYDCLVESRLRSQD